MKPIIEREDNSAKLNLTVPLLVWLAVFGALALWLESWAWFWVGVLPILAWFGFATLLMIIGLTAFAVGYMQGHPIKVTTPRGGTRTVQRKR